MVCIILDVTICLPDNIHKAMPVTVTQHIYNVTILALIFFTPWLPASSLFVNLGTISASHLYNVPHSVFEAERQKQNILENCLAVSTKTKHTHAL
jgi:hypothetical protein